MQDPLVVKLDTYEAIRETSLGRLQGNRLQKELRKKAKFITTLIDGANAHALDSQGYMVVIDGSWGTGKTVSAHALVNHLKSRSSNLVDIPSGSFLPFGNVNESIASFLQMFAHELWTKNVLDIRKDIQAFILEATPANEIQRELSITAGPFSFSKSWASRSKNMQGQLLMQERFKLLIKNKKTIVVIIDDIDRLAPQEIVAVLRMAEKVRRLPRTIVIVPMFKRIVNEALVKEIGLSDTYASNSFLHKLTDAEIRLSYAVNEMKQVFIQEFDAYQSFQVTGYGSLPAFCWNALLHCLILSEAVEYSHNQTQSGQESRKILNEIFSRSSYIRDIFELIERTSSKAAPQRFPVRVHTNSNAYALSALGALYDSMAQHRMNATWALSDMEFLLETDHAFRRIITSHAAKHALERTDSTPWEERYATPNINHFFKLGLIPLLEHSRSEQFLTDSYGMRDIKTLAREIQQHRDFDVSELTPQRIYTIIVNAFRAFRFGNNLG